MLNRSQHSMHTPSRHLMTDGRPTAEADMIQVQHNFVTNFSPASQQYSQHHQMPLSNHEMDYSQAPS
jgi:hypothetical protein